MVTQRERGPSEPTSGAGNAVGAGRRADLIDWKTSQLGCAARLVPNLLWLTLAPEHVFQVRARILFPRAAGCGGVRRPPPPA
jgi:hypothetical protein